MEEKKISYSTDEISVSWQPHLCKHAGVCVKMLPKVYHPKEKPWIKVDQASTQELMDQIDKCPSGALSYRLGKQ